MPLNLGAYTACLHDRTPRGALDILKGNGLTSVEVNTGSFTPAPHSPDRTLVWNQPHLLRECEQHHNAGPTRPLARRLCFVPFPQPSPVHVRSPVFDVRRRDRLGGTLHEYRHAT
ncbi:hypothetical protein ACFVDQ_21220 [Streptomyces sp. NPDC057684]|uniref:hypothetical protein n=1 Tax=Streptomyces sp. NPDC057684 TaxID=3346211 RepID=UPI0036B5DA54